MKRLALLTIGLAFCVAGVAQEVAFKTLAAKGTCMVQRASNSDEYVSVKTGVRIFPGDKIIITGDNAYIGLVSDAGKTVEISKSGVYNADDLSAGLVQADASLAEKYVKFLMDDMSKSDESIARNMEFTGSVERSIENSDIVVFLPETTKIVSNEASVIWFPKSDFGQYTLEIKNLFDEVVYTQSTKDTRVAIDFSTIDLNEGEIYKLQIKADGGSSSIVTLHVPESGEMETYTADLGALSSNDKTAIQKMVLATYCEKNGLYLNAIPYYEDAIMMEPDIQEFKRAYNSFLYSVGLESAME